MVDIWYLYYTYWTMIQFIPASSRWHAHHGRLQTAYSFSFSSYYDPKRMHFWALRVLNDDIIAGGNGFPEHPHDNMEIITIVTSGELEHGDNMGNWWIIRAGDVQVMSAGTGVEHSEFNPSTTEPAALFQLWIYPHTENLPPRYDQRSFDWQNMENNQRLVASGDGREGSLLINTNASITMWVYESWEDTLYTMTDEDHGVYLMCISGSIEVWGKVLNARDAVEITDMEDIEIQILEDAQWMAIEVEMIE